MNHWVVWMSFGAEPTRFITQPHSSVIRVWWDSTIKIKVSMYEPLYIQDPNPLSPPFLLYWVQILLFNPLNIVCVDVNLRQLKFGVSLQDELKEKKIIFSIHSSNSLIFPFLAFLVTITVTELSSFEPWLLSLWCTIMGCAYRLFISASIISAEWKVVDRKPALMNLFSHHHSRETIHIQTMLLAACQHSIRIEGRHLGHPRIPSWCQILVSSGVHYISGMVQLYQTN